MEMAPQGKRVARATSGWIGLLAGALALSACGGSSDESGSPPGPSDSFAQQCAPTNPYAAAILRTASLDTEKQWVRAYLNEAYLWYDQMPLVNASAPAYSNTSDVLGSLGAYFDASLTQGVTSSGALTDRFSFITPTSTSNALFDSGVEAGTGVQWRMLSGRAPRGIRVAYIEPGSEAATKGVRRGDTLLTVDGVSADDQTSAGVDVLNAALFPSATGGTHTYVLSRAGAANVTVSMTTAAITTKPVLSYGFITATDGQKVGNIVFNAHVAPAEGQLITAVNYLKTQGVTDLVLDLRYNGGGYLYIASELAYMIAGPSRTTGKVFEKFNYNAKRVADNNRPAQPFDSLDGNDAALPTLNLSRVYVLTTASTCSASESIINSLRGVDVDVRQIGSASCGKPYGFAAKDNCGISYFPIEFKGVNAKGFGDYTDGFVPNGSGAAGVPGCVAGDDFTHELGDANEGLLKAALDYRTSGSCPVAASSESPQSVGRALAGSGIALRGNPLLHNRIVKAAR